MDKVAIKRTSALEGYYMPGQYGDRRGPNIIFCELNNLLLYQFAFWPETFVAGELQLARLLGINSIPNPGESISNGDTALLRIEPLKVWVVGFDVPPFETDSGVILNLSHSRTHLLISGSDTTKLLNRFLPVDLRESSFPRGSVISTAFHHVGVTLWRTEAGYQLLIPRSFALSLWELLLKGAAQFGCEVVPAQ